MLKINKEELCEDLAYALIERVIMPTLEENQCINFFVTKTRKDGVFFTLKCNTDWEINPDKSEAQVTRGERITSGVLEAAVKMILDNYGTAKIETINSETTMYRFEKT